MIRALLPLPFGRLATARRGWIAPAGWTALVVASAIASRSRHSGAVDHVLLGAYADFGLPFLAFAVVSVVLGGMELARASAPMVCLGALPDRAALAHALVAAAASAAAGAFVGAVAVLIAHGSESAPLVADVGATAYAGALGGAAYASLFVLGSAFGAKGAGRGTLLFADFLLGTGSGVGAMLLPRAHVRNLLGESGDLPLSARASGACLVALAVAYALGAALRARRTP